MTMKPLKLRRRFEQTLSEGQGMQLLWLIIAILIVFFVFWGIATFFFRDHSLGWQDVLSLFLDPGNFEGKGNHDAFRLIATIFGVFLFSALLISVVSNIFENIADSFKNGHTRHTHKGHVLILGGSNQLISILVALLEEDAPYKSSDIVVLTCQPINDLREKLFTLPYLDKHELRKRLSLYYGSRDNENDLKCKNLARNASVIYIIGEDNEPDHDSISIKCYEELNLICSTSIRFYLVFSDSSSRHVYNYEHFNVNDPRFSRIDAIDWNEYISSQVIVENPRYNYPKIDYREIIKDGDSFKEIPGIRSTDNNYVHLVIAGFSDMAKTMACTAAHICHFPNFENGKRRTIITFVDSGMKDKMDCFVNSMPSLFNLSHYKYKSFDAQGKEVVISHKPDVKFGDFLDIEWEFVDTELYSPNATRLLETLIQDKNRSLSIIIAKESQSSNASLAIHLPRFIYDNGYPVFVYQQESSKVLSLAKKTHQFGNLNIFGMATEIQDDPLFIFRSKKAKRVNFIYNQEFAQIPYKDEEEAWDHIIQAHKFSSIYCANAMTVRARSFGLGEGRTVADLSDEERISIYEVEHRRWVLSELILGYIPMEKAYLDKWKERRLSPDEDVQKAAKQEFKSQKTDHFIHYDITPYDALLPSEKEKDKVIIDKMEYILGE